MKLLLFICAFCLATISYAQDISSNSKTKKLAVRDTIAIDSVSINPFRFELRDKNGVKIDSLDYKIDYKNSLLIVSENIKQANDSITVDYYRYPDFLTKDYFTLDPKIIVENPGVMERLYSLEQASDKSVFTPFEGLNTVGSISRGVTIGNNQNAVVPAWQPDTTWTWCKLM